MSDLIQILPDNVANQIAAGEVVQRPASVIKELVENAIDAGAGAIVVNVTDAGKTRIQVIDDGCGMSVTDARLAFERHATSKIRATQDLFGIRTMGFRGEALASIAAVSKLELKTKRTEDEFGTQIVIEGSDFISQEASVCSNGSNFVVKNLFFNVPARRKFLKTNATEFRNIISEFHRIALAHSDISFRLIHNNNETYRLPAANIRQRIVNVFGKTMNARLIRIDTETEIVKLSGFVGKPENAKKNMGEQFFFVNKRFMKHPYFYRAVMQAYDRILPQDTVPSYFIFFEVDPKIIDINIHPTKTEIKFEDERAIFQIIQASIREALGKFNIVPSIDFDEDRSLKIPIQQPNKEIKSPGIRINSEFNPFEQSVKSFSFSGSETSNYNGGEGKNSKGWEKLYEGVSDQTSQTPQEREDSHDQNWGINGLQQQIALTEDERKANKNFFQLKNRYILTPIRSGLMIIDQRKAHERILFEKFMASLENHGGIAQQSLFPQTVELDASDCNLLKMIIKEVKALGFDVREFGKQTFVVNGTPADIKNCEPKELLEDLLANYKANQLDVKLKVRENLARSLAKSAAIRYGKPLNDEEMSEIVDRLFACKTPNFTPNGKPVISILEMGELENRFK